MQSINRQEWTFPRNYSKVKLVGSWKERERERERKVWYRLDKFNDLSTQKKRYKKEEENVDDDKEEEEEEKKDDDDDDECLRSILSANVIVCCRCTVVVEHKIVRVIEFLVPRCSVDVEIFFIFHLSFYTLV